MKKLTTILLFLVVLVSFGFSKDFSFFLNGLDQHPEILGGFLPTGSGIGINYDGLSIKDGDLTRIQLKLGAGYLQRQIFQNPVTGEFLRDKYQKIGIFDEFHFTWSAEFSQGFGDSWVDGLDFVTAYAGYQGKYEKFYDSLIILKGGGGFPKKTDYKIWLGEKSKGQPDSIEGFMARYGADRASQKIYQDLAKDNNYTSILYTGARINAMKDTWTASRGFLLDLKLSLAPAFMNKVSTYYSAQLNAVGGATILELKRRNGLNLFSIVFIDRINFTFIDGDAVPVFASHVNSLGRKMRGFDNNTFNTTFSLVNNFDIRFASPEPFIRGIFARLNLFLDLGYGAGYILNTGKNGIKEISESGLLASTGAQLELSIFDTIDLGLQVAYLINGSAYRNRSEDVLVSATFFLDF